MAIPNRAWDGFFAERRAAKVSVESDLDKVPKLEARLFEEQRRAYESEADYQCRLAGRRGGKTLLNATDLIVTAIENPGQEMSLYITLTKHHSRRNLERQLDKDIRDFNLAFRKSEVDGQLYYTHKNGHVVWLTGCKDRSEADKLRGDKYRKVIIDEAGSERFAAMEKGQTEGEEQRDLLQYLVNEVLEHALSDLNGQLVLSGSPGTLPRGFFWQVSTGDGPLAQWETHHWTVLQNPHHRYGLRHPHTNHERFKRTALRNGCELYSDAEVEELQKQGVVPLYPGMPWLKKASPAFRRETLAEWVSDHEAMCYSFVASKNGFDDSFELPQGQWFYVLGVDIGFNDQATFVVTASRRGFAEVYFLEAHGRAEMQDIQITAEILRISQRYKLNKVVIDPGGGGKFQIEGLKERQGINAEAASKPAKGAAIRTLQSGLRVGSVKIHMSKCRQLVDELLTITWNQDRTNHNPSDIDDTADAAVYAYRAHPTHERWDEEPPKAGTPAAVNAEMAAYKATLAKKQAIVHSGMKPSQKRRALKALRR